MPDYHKPVLLNETITLLDPKEGGIFVDATLGGAGHAAAILEKIGPNGRLIGIDRDQEAIERSRERLKEFGDRAILVKGNFKDLNSILESVGISEIDGALFDLGVSSHQLDSERGFSFSRDEELDMRMSPQDEGPDAKHVVNDYSEVHLAELIYKYGDERYSRRIARMIVEKRWQAPITTTKELADIVTQAIPAQNRWQDIHPATRTFQAIRIEVNKELEAVEVGVPAAIEALKIGGRVCVISFHSLEDRIVKQAFRRYAGHCECPPKLPICVCGAKKTVKILTGKPIISSAEEISGNPRSRSSKLRCAQKIS
ncbi:MAG: 16S rRNA (cytosine(1402)-N(4))-methyltransferase RsmH [Armatimonadetes bacterium]|nr:16S rRNA (cytosine(1402)-N(4))-methyltransferase RsmH [Armatimonadota bacterium]